MIHGAHPYYDGRGALKLLPSLRLSLLEEEKVKKVEREEEENLMEEVENEDPVKEKQDRETVVILVVVVRGYSRVCLVMADIQVEIKLDSSEEANIVQEGHFA